MEINGNNNLASQNLANPNHEQQNNKDNQNQNENQINNEKISFLEKPVIPERTISNYYGNEFLVDAVLKCDDVEIPFHKIVLCSASNFIDNYFKLNPDMTQKSIVNLPEIMKSSLSQGDKKECLDKILKYCYYNQDIKSIESDINQKNCFTFLELAHCLQIKSLSTNLEKIIIQKYLNNENILKISEECNNFELDELLKECSKKIKRNLANIQNIKKDILELKYNSFKDIISSDELDVEQEKDVAQLVIEYIKSRGTISEEKKVENQENLESNEKNEQNKENEKEKKKEEEEEKEKKKEKEKNENDKNEQNNDNNNTGDPYNNWKQHLEELKKKSIKNKLTPEEEKMLILCIRFSYLSHPDLIELTNEPIMKNYQELILQGLSARLDPYENSKDKKTIINLAPRHYLKGQQMSYNNNDNQLSPMSRYNNGQRNLSSLYQFNDQRNIVASYDDENNINNNMNMNMNTSNSNNFLNMDDMNTRMAIMAKSAPGPGLYPPQDPRNSNNFFHSQRNISNYNPIFKYSYDFDENGALYYLGTRGKQYQYRNPHELQLVTAFGSSLSMGHISDFVGRNLVNLRTENEENSFLGVDLGENRTLLPTAYSLRNRNSSTHVLLCWNLEASNDRINFVILDTRLFNNVDNPQIHQKLEKERNLLKEPGCTSTWGISRKVRQRYPDGFRYFLIKQIDRNSNGTYNLTNSGFEIYGEAKGNGWIFN